jgi:hypothetical protein
MSEQTQTQTNPAPAGGIVYAYTQHEATIKIIETTCGVEIRRLKQDRSKDPVEDILSQIPNTQVTLYAVLPADKAIELKRRAPWIRLLLLQLDGNVVEKLTGRPYNPKSDYPSEIIIKALKIYEVKGGYVRYLRSIDDFFCENIGRKIVVFNDTLREALNILNERASVKVVRTCERDDDNSICTEVNPFGLRPGYRISFPGNVGKLTTEQMIDLIKRCEARIYYVDIQAQEVPLCP